MEDFEKILDLPCDKITKEMLVNVVTSNDDYRAYEMLFEMYGDTMTRDEYIDYRIQYDELFDIDIQFLPDCCCELDEKWEY